MQADFSGLWLPIITPFHEGQADLAALARLARHLATQGIRGFVAGATTGKGLLLTDAEQESVFTTLREAVPTLPIVQGLSQTATAQAISHARRLRALHPDGLLVTPPSYVRPSQDGIRAHFEAIAEAADLPILIYNIPYRTGVNIELPTLQQLARDRRLAGIKECGGSMERMLQLVHDTPLRVFSGDDNQNFPALCLGAHGCIASSAHLLTRWHVRLQEYVVSGQLEQARQVAVALRPLVAACFAEPNPAPVKAALAVQGWCQPELRLPFLPASAALATQLAALLEEAEKALSPLES